VSILIRKTIFHLKIYIYNYAYGCTPLMLAVFSKKFIIAKYLIDQGADPEINYKGISTKNLAFKSAFVTFLNQHH